MLNNVRIYNRALTAQEVSQLYTFESTPAIAIAQDLTNTYAVYGHSASFSISSTGLSALSYQWYFVPSNGGGQAGAYAQTIVGFVYGAVVTNGGFGYGNVPSVNFVGGGGVGASGYATVSNGVVTGITVTNAGSGYSSLPAVVLGAPNGLLLGQTNSTLIVNNANENSLGNYYVVVSNGSGSVTSSVANLTLLYPPSITINPVGYIGNLRSSNVLTVAAVGTPPLSYQWRINGTNINSGTNSSYAVNNLSLAKTGAYSVVVLNPYGSATSSVANVYLAPALASPFSGAIGLWGQSTTLGVGATGSGSLRYQWYFNGAAIPGATGSSYGFDSIQLTNAGLYSVVVSSDYGSVTNTAYQVVVNPASVDIGLYPAVGINGTVGYSYTIQSSTDLSNTNSWLNETNLILSAPYQKWSDYNSMGVHKYYRVVPGQ